MKAYATRTSGDLYDVHYEGGSFDSEVSGRFLDNLVRDGITVHCDNRNYEPRSHRYEIGTPGEDGPVWRTSPNKTW